MNKTIMEDNIKVLSVSELIEFEDLPFVPYEGTRFLELVESINSFGIITPIIVRDVGDRYQILSGHNRVNAAKQLNLEEVPAIIKRNISDELAMVIVTESNILQRGFNDLKLSERARCISIRHEILKKRGIRTDLIKDVDHRLYLSDNYTNVMKIQFEGRYNCCKVIAESFGLSPRSVSRFIRIDKLISSLKPLLDQKLIQHTAAIDLSYLAIDEQEIVDAIVRENKITVDLHKASQLRQLSKSRRFDWSTAYNVLVKINEPKSYTLKISEEVVVKYFEGYKREKISEIVNKAIDLYFEIEVNGMK